MEDNPFVMNPLRLLSKVICHHAFFATRVKIHCASEISICLIAVCLILFHASAAGADDGTQDDMMSKATSYYFKKQFDMAENLLRQAVTQNPENAKAHAYLADILLIKKRYDEALSHYRASLELDPQSGENYFRIGQVYYYKQNGPEAVENFKKAIEIDPQLRFAYYHIGLTYLMIMRDKQHTIENWEKYLAIAPDDPQNPKIRRAIELLKDPNFALPPPDSDITIEEALLLGGMSIDTTIHQSTDMEAGHEKKKTKRELEDLYLDEDI